MSVKTMIKTSSILVAILMVGAFVMSGAAVAGGNEGKAKMEKPKAAIEKVEKVEMVEPAEMENSSASKVKPRKEILIRRPFERLNPFLLEELFGEEGLIGEERLGID